jgi:hypothetical protein
MFTGEGMRRQGSIRRAVVWLAMSVWLPAVTARDTASLERAAEWEMAALNRQMAAETYEIRGRELALQADDLVRQPNGKQVERRERLGRAANLAMQSGGKYGAAVKAFEKARSDWLNAAAQGKKAKSDIVARDYAGQAQDAGRCARAAAVNAARSFEMAAELFDVDNADQPDRSAAAGEQAAAWREKLASWK